MNRGRFLPLLSAAAFLALTGCVSLSPSSTASVYTATVETGLPADRAYDLTSRWISSSFADPTAVLRGGDRAHGQIEGPGWTILSSTAFEVDRLQYELTITLAEGEAGFSIEPRYIMRTVYVMRDTIFPRDEPVPVRTKLDVDPASYALFARQMDQVLVSFTSFVSEGQH